MDLQSCRIVCTTLKSQRGGPPAAVAIVIAPTKREGEELALQELRRFVQMDFPHTTKDLGPILYPPVSSVLFLYTQTAGRIK